MQKETAAKENIILHKPVCSRKSLHFKTTNERSEANASVCLGYKDINTKKKMVED